MISLRPVLLPQQRRRRLCQLLVFIILVIISNLFNTASTVEAARTATAAAPIYNATLYGQAIRSISVWQQFSTECLLVVQETHVFTLQQPLFQFAYYLGSTQASDDDTGINSGLVFTQLPPQLVQSQTNVSIDLSSSSASIFSSPLSNSLVSLYFTDVVAAGTTFKVTYMYIKNAVFNRYGVGTHSVVWTPFPFVPLATTVQVCYQL